MSDIALNSQENGALWFQPDGPNTQPYYLGCYDVDDISESKGAVNLLYCITNLGAYKVAGRTLDPPDVITFNLGTYAGKTREYLENAPCPSVLYLLLRDCGRADLFDNWVRLAILDVQAITGRTLSGWVKRAESTEAMISFEAAAAPPIFDGFGMQGYRQSISEAEEISGIAFCNDRRCAGSCGSALSICQNGFLTTLAQVGSPANVSNVWHTTNGSTWTSTTTQPFGAGIDIIGAVCVQLNKDTVRWIVGRGEAVAGQPAQIAYSDNSGAAWTTVNVGSVTGQFIGNAHAIFALDRYNIWVAASGGYIYKSTDAGVTWTAQESGVITTGAYTAIYFKDRFTGLAVSASDVVSKTVDGGATWSAGAATGSAAGLSAVIWNGLFWWVSTTNGRIYYSSDHATTWTRRAGWDGDGTGQVVSMDWANKLQGFMARVVSGVGSVLTTWDGGFSWKTITISTNSGLNQIYVCGNDLAYIVGDINAATGYVARVQLQN